MEPTGSLWNCNTQTPRVVYLASRHRSDKQVSIRGSPSFKKNWRTSVLFVGSLIPLFWTSGDVCPGFQSQGRRVQWIPQIHLSKWERESKFYAFLALGTEVAKVMFSEASVSHSVHMGWVPTLQTWHLPHTVSKRAVRILLECFLVIFISTRNKFKEDITQFYNFWRPVSHGT